MSQQDRIKQALHNETVSKYLEDSGNFNDWVITTAFYSALHFVQHKIFPLKHVIAGKERTFACFDDYYSTCNMSSQKISRHTETINLVKKNIPAIFSQYRRLKDICHSARYNTYLVKPIEVINAKLMLQEIKSACVDEIIPITKEAIT